MDETSQPTVVSPVAPVFSGKYIVADSFDTPSAHFDPGHVLTADDVALLAPALDGLLHLGHVVRDTDSPAHPEQVADNPALARIVAVQSRLQAAGA